MMNVPSVYSPFTVSLRFSTALTHACVDCGHFVFPLDSLCFFPPPFSPPPPPPSLSPPSPLAVDCTIERSWCADSTDGELCET